MAGQVEYILDHSESTFVVVGDKFEKDGSMELLREFTDAVHTIKRELV